MQPRLHSDNRSQNSDRTATTSVSLRCLARVVFVPRCCKRLRALATWTSPRQRDSVLLLLAWWITCLWFRFIIVYLAPLSILLYGIYRWRHKITFPYDEEERLRQALETLDAIEQFQKAWWGWFEWHERPVETRRRFATMVYLYLGWLAAHQYLDTYQIMLVVGTLALIWSSPWTRRYLPLTFLKSVMLAILVGPLERKLDGSFAPLMQRAEDFQRQLMHTSRSSCQKRTTGHFEFVIYENQRFWPGTGWRSVTLSPIERASWTDAAKQPVPSKAHFTLPETIQTKSTAGGEQTWIWTWKDSDWRLDLTDLTDELGWSYGTVFWSVFNREAKGWWSTRRRRWARTAQLTSETPDTRLLSVETDARPNESASCPQSVLSFDSRSSSTPLHETNHNRRITSFVRSTAFSNTPSSAGTDNTDKGSKKKRWKQISERREPVWKSVRIKP